MSKIQLSRAIIALASVLLFSIAWITFYEFFSLPTDENLFRDVNTKLVVVKKIPGVLIESKPFQGTQPQAMPTRLDSLSVGDLVMTINGGEVKTIKDAYGAVYNSPKNEMRIEVLRPSLNYRLTFNVSPKNIKNESFELLPNYVYIIDVTTGGASDRGGMKIGDLIIRINNRDFQSAIEADRIMRLGQAGKSLKYEILRANRYVELNIVLAKFGIPVSVLIFCLSGFLFMIIGSFIVISRPNIFGAFLLGISFLLIGYSMSIMAIRRDFDSSVFVIIRNVLFGGGISIGFAMLLHAMHFFPIERSELNTNKWLARSHYIISLIVVTIAALTNSGFPFLIYPVYIIFFLVKYRKYATSEYKRLNKLIRWSYTIVGLISICIAIFFNDQLGIFGLGIYGVLLLMIPLSYLYTIGRYRLLDLRLRVRRNTQYSVLTAIWSVLVFYLLIWVFFRLPQLDFPTGNIVFTGASIEVNDSPEFDSERVSTERVLLMVLSITVAFVFIRVRGAGQKLIDRKYFRMQYDYRKAQQELGELLVTTLSMQELGKGFVQKLSELMKLKTAGVIFFREERCCACEEAFGFDGDEWKNFCVKNESMLISSMQQFQNEIRIQYLPPLIKEEFQREGFQYLIPIRSKEKLIGTILVGEKQSETTFRQEDLTFLTTAAKQASVAIENAFLYEELTEKERMKHELQIARRIQLESLPQSIPHVDGLDISGISIPAMEVGGDFYDYLTDDNSKLTVIVGDVSGKGTSAALYMSKVQGILRSLHGFNLSPRELFSRANKLLCQDLEKRSFVTVLGAEFDVKKKKMIVARAGHLPLWHYKASSGEIDTVIPKGLGLGLNDAGVFTSEMEEKEIAYTSGDVFLFATDGVTEARNSVGDFGEERLNILLKENQQKSAEDIQKFVAEELSRFAGSSKQHDDQTIVIVKAK